MSSIGEQVRAMRKDAAVLLRPDVRTLRLDGPDAGRFLNGMVTNDVLRLLPGRGMMAVKTTNKGRVEGVMRVRRTEDAFLIDIREAAAAKVLDALARFIIMDDCAIADMSHVREVISLVGPEARSLLVAPELEPHAFITSQGRTIIRDAMLGLDAFEVHLAPGSGEAAMAELEGKGAARASLEALDVARIEAGVPLDGRDLDDDTIPLEARLERAIDFHKGCYIGQEVISRATNLGGVKHILVGLLVDGPAVPGAGEPLVLPDTQERIGEVTSAAYSPTLERVVALGYVRRTHEAEGTKLSVAGAGALVTKLPFVG